jgi:hypothetical protein
MGTVKGFKNKKGQFIPTQQDQHVIDARDKTRKQLSRFTDDEQRMLNVWGQKSKSNASIAVSGGDKESNIAPYQRMLDMDIAKHDHKGAYDNKLDLLLVPTTKGRKFGKGYNRGMALLANDPIYLKEFGEKHGKDRSDFHQYVLNKRNLNKQGFY